jgi:uncharacterized membrane protein YeaQ/YmgE (transglycosylase-associated protein family)
MEGAEEMLELVWIIVIGALVGTLVKFVMPGSDPGGVFVAAVLGMEGALVATLLGRVVGLYGPKDAGFISSIVGALVVLFVYRSLRKRQA